MSYQIAYKEPAGNPTSRMTEGNPISLFKIDQEIMQAYEECQNISQMSPKSVNTD
jgi:hypothetical protein